MGRKKYYGDCYLCGEYDKLTKDHIPPQCFAPNPLESFKQTSISRFHYAYACSDCNEYYGRLEKSFKNIMLMGSSSGIQAADDAWNKIVSENRKSLDKYGMQSKEFRDIINAFPEKEIYSRGSISLGRWRVMEISRDSKLLEEFIKIARGLHYVHTHEIIPTTYEMGVAVNDKVTYFDRFKPPFFRLDTDFFEYYGTCANDNRKIGLWYMRFYKGYTAQVWFRPKN